MALFEVALNIGNAVRILLAAQLLAQKRREINKRTWVKKGRLEERVIVSTPVTSSEMCLNKSFLTLCT